MFVTWGVFFIGLVAVLPIPLVRGDDEDCTPENVDRCMGPLRAVDFEQDGDIMPDKEFLDTHCGPVQSALQCRIDFNNRCPDSDADVEPQLNRPMLDLLNLMCDDDSEIKKGYLENVQCYDENQMQLLICAAASYAMLSDFVEHAENRTDIPPDVDLGSCIGIPTLLNCVITEISQECGEEETAPLAQILHRFIDVIRENLCPADELPILEEEFENYLNTEDKKRKK